MKNDTKSVSGSQVGSWVKKALYGSAVVGLAMTMGMQSATAGSPSTKQGFKKFTPVSRVASMNVVRVKGQIDYEASYAKARAASIALATYVARLKESDMLGADVIQGIDWKLGGTDKTCLEERNCSDEMIDEAVLAIPSPNPINPNLPMSKANTKKANVLDFCNKKYASLAMGVTPIIGDKKVVNGYSHAPALPCEVSVWLDDDKIYVDMLDPSAIFTLFFSDVLFSADMQDREFADALGGMTVQVKTEIREIIQAAISEFDPEMKALDKNIGPVYDSVQDIIDVVASSTYQSPYKHVKYTRTDGGVFIGTAARDDGKTIAQAIITTLSTHDSAPGVHPTYLAVDINDNPVTDRIDDGDDVVTLDDVLSKSSSWRSARIAPISIPGRNHIVEACSPKYAKMAMGTGLDHVNALPCEITTKVLPDGSLVVSYLDPDFMLKSLFADISDADKAKFGAIPGIIMTDLQNIVKAAVENSGYQIDDGTQISYDMLP